MTEEIPSSAAVSEVAPAACGPVVVQRVAGELSRQLAMPLEPGLHLVATPIGNLGDITVRALATLANADVIYCEDTRHSRTLLSHFGIGGRLEAYHEHNGERERPRVLAFLASGKRVALISDAGTPLLSDPGYKLVRDVIEAGHRVWSIPGPSALLPALTSSGLPSDAVLFAGFLPVRSAGRRARAGELAHVPATLVFYEAPTRVAEALGDLAAMLGDRPAAVARELTKRFETIERGTLGELAAAFEAREVKGEIVIVIGSPMAREATDTEIAAAVQAALATMSLRDASKAVAEALGVAKSRVYEIGLAMKATDREG